jgi:glucuronate isomerase
MLADRLAQDLYTEFGRFPLVDTYTHLDPRRPTARGLDDLLSYHYYPELAIATGMDRAMLSPNVDPRDRVRAVFYHLVDFFPNTVQQQWFLEIAHAFLGFAGERLTFADCTRLFDEAERRMARPDWEQTILRAANIERVFVNNPFDDPLDGFDTRRYVPCLGADDLVFGLDNPEVRRRLGEVTRVEVSDASSLGHALAARFEHFTRYGARAVTLAVPPDFAPVAVAEADLSRALEALARRDGRQPPNDDHLVTCARGAFRSVVEQCRLFHLPFQLMIDPSCRAAHSSAGGDPVVEFAGLFAAFPTVTFCVSEISRGLNLDVVNLGRVFANVMSTGHGGDGNHVPARLEQAIRVRLQAVPQTKQIGYYSGLNKLEFAMPQFNMYRRVLAHVLATEFVHTQVYTVWQALELARLLLRDNARRIFDV